MRCEIPNNIGYGWVVKLFKDDIRYVHLDDQECLQRGVAGISCMCLKALGF